MQKFLSQPFFVAEQFTGFKGQYLALADTTSRGFQSILAGEMDDVPEQAFWMCGPIEMVREKAEKMAPARSPPQQEFETGAGSPEGEVDASAHIFENKL